MKNDFSKADQEKMVYLVKSSQRSYEYVARRYGTTADVVRDIVYKLYYGGKSVKANEERVKKFCTETINTDTVDKQIILEYPLKNEAQTITFGAMGDNHSGSIYAQITQLHKFYDILAERGITEVYHTGDITEGEQMRMGHHYECYVHGVDAHLEEVVKNYPRREGITTYFITGNHDDSIHKRCGCDIGKMIAAARPDLVYLGKDIARVQLSKNCSMMLKHPYDGGAGSVSCAVQRLVDNMYSNKPNILLVGNYHKVEHLFYKGVHIIQTGSYQGDTKFTKSKNLRVDRGGWIITIGLDKDGNITRFVGEQIPFYDDIDDDWRNWR